MLQDIQNNSHVMTTSLIGILGLLGVVFLLKLSRKRVNFCFRLFGQKTKRVQFDLKEPINTSKEFKPINKENDPELSVLDCSLVSKFTECPYAKNNEKIPEVELSEEENKKEQEYRKGQLNLIFQLLKEQEAARNNSKEDSILYEKIPKFSYSKGETEEEYKFSVLNHETLEYTPLEEKELENELENIFSSQIKLYGL